MVDRLLALKARLEAALAASLGGAPAFGATLRDALSCALNARCAAGRVVAGAQGGGGRLFVCDCLLLLCLFFFS